MGYEELNRRLDLTLRRHRMILEDLSRHAEKQRQSRLHQTFTPSSTIPW